MTHTDRRIRPSLARIRAALLALTLFLPVAAAAQTGSISGTVTNAQTAAPIVGLEVVAYRVDQFDAFGFDATDATGAYTITGLPPGRYVVFTLAERDPAFPFLDEGFDNIPCVNRNNCDFPELTDATLVTVTAGGTAANINFALDPLGRVTGTVTDDTGAPRQNVRVDAVIRLGNSAFFVDSATTDAAGVYTLTRLPAGTVYLYTSNSLGLVNEIFDNITCVGQCSPTTAITSGAAVPVTAGGTTTGRDFSLLRGARITGTITNASTGAPVQNVTVQAMTRVGGTLTTISNGSSNASGVYTIGGLPTGNYVIFTTGGFGVMHELYNDILCPLNCNPIAASGEEIPVTAPQLVENKNFALQPGGGVSGTVTGPSGPLQNVQVTVATRVGTTNFSRTATTNASGNYNLGGLPPGRYWMYTSSVPFGFVPEIFDDLPCLGPCNINTAITMGAPIDVALGATTSGRNFTLSMGGAITGTVRYAATGQPVDDDLDIQVYARSGSSHIFITSVGGDSQGRYQVSGLAAGDYVIATNGFAVRNEAYDNIPCVGASCQAVLGSATPITVALGTTVTGKDFSLDRAEILLGKVTSSATGQPLTSGVTVTIYQRGSGAFVGSTSIDYRGGFAFTGLPNGTYVAYTSNTIGYRNEIYNDIPCATTCSSQTALANGTPISVTSAGAGADSSPSLVTGITFALDPRTAAPAAPTNFRVSVNGFTALFNWTPPTPSTTGVPDSYVIDAGVAPGTTIVSLPAGSGTSFTLPGVPPGTFYVRLRAINAAGSSPPSNEVMLAISGAGVSSPLAPTNPVAFLLGDQLTFTWSANAAGEPPTGYLVEAGSASGLANIATLPVSGRSLTYNGVPPGFYFLRVRATNAGGVSPPSAEVMIVVVTVP